MCQPVVEKCAYQRCDLVTLSVICTKRSNVACEWSGTNLKHQCCDYKPVGSSYVK
jgi:hypothetical protein